MVQQDRAVPLVVAVSEDRVHQPKFCGAGGAPWDGASLEALDTAAVGGADTRGSVNWLEARPVCHR